MIPARWILALGVGVAPLAAQAQTVIRNVGVVDVGEGRTRPGMTVILRGNRIAAVTPAGQASEPARARVIDGTGQYLIPGLWDMHVHLTHVPGVPDLYVANGVTGVREMGGPPVAILALRDSIRRGLKLGPRIFAAGPTVDGPKDADFRYTIVTAEDGRRAVDSLARMNVDLIKTHNGVSPEAFFALLRRARERRIPVGVHFARNIRIADAVDSGINSVEHVASVWETMYPVIPPTTIEALRATLRGILTDGAPATFARMQKRGVWFVPTLVAARASADRVNPEYAPDSTVPRYVPQGLRAYWDRWFPQVRNANPLQIQGRQMVFEESLALVRAAHAAGVGILAATDVALIYVYPGFSLHDELDLLVQSGLSPIDALRAATLNPARHLGVTDSMGSIAPGKVADLVLLEANPLDDIRNTRRIAGVAVGGRWLTRIELDSLLSGAKSK